MVMSSSRTVLFSTLYTIPVNVNDGIQGGHPRACISDLTVPVCDNSLRTLRATSPETVWGPLATFRMGRGISTVLGTLV